MTEQAAKQVTRILTEAPVGDPATADRLLPLVYEELRRLAHHRMAKEPPGQTLQPTALVHEAYLRLVRAGDIPWESRAHFFGAAARAMRRILVERARRKHPRKGLVKEAVLGSQGEGPFSGDESVDVLALERALAKLESVDPRKSEVVCLRFYAGLSVDETAAALGLSPRTVKGEWRAAKAWLFREIRDGPV